MIRTRPRMSANNETPADSRSLGEVPDDNDSGTMPIDPLMLEAHEEASRRGRARSNSQERSSEQSKAASGLIGNSEALHSLSDEALFQHYQQGNQQAFLRLYERYKSSIYGYCARTIMSAGLDEALIDDTFQEVFLRVAQYQHTFTGGEFRAWIFTVTRHTCLSAKKKGMKHRVMTEQVGDAENLDEDVSSSVRTALAITDDPLENLSKQEQTALLVKAIQELPETYREALILSDYEGLTYDEIGKLTGTSLSTIRIRIFRAKARLRKVLLPIIGDQADAHLGQSPGEE